MSSVSLPTDVVHTVLSWAGAHECLQLKHQKLGVGGYTEGVLKWFDCPRASAHPGCEVSCPVCTKLTCIAALPVLR